MCAAPLGRSLWHVSTAATIKSAIDNKPTTKGAYKETNRSLSTNQ